MLRDKIIRAMVLILTIYSGCAAGAEDLEPLNIELPILTHTGHRYSEDPHVEKASSQPRPPFLAPKGAYNLARNKKVTSSDQKTVSGSLAIITDGDKESDDNQAESHYVELHYGTQWVQIDLEAPHNLYAIMVWHDHHVVHLYFSVIVQVADDAAFTQNVRTLFNNDYENAIGLGAGKDLQYFEYYDGKLVDAKGTKARYVRLYSRGSTYSNRNRYTEVEVCGK